MSVVHAQKLIVTNESNSCCRFECTSSKNEKCKQWKSKVITLELPLIKKFLQTRQFPLNCNFKTII